MLKSLFSFQKEEPVKNGKDSAKPAEAATNGNDEDGDDDLDIDDIQNTVPPHTFTSLRKISFLFPVAESCCLPKLLLAVCVS